ncbi:MAG: endonuclease/exonuclease/phosphatase family protein, partial [Candidatus Competibacterales bacterium]
MNTIGIPGQPSPVSSFDDNRTSEPAANMRLPETLAATPEGGRGPRVMTGFGGETTAPPIQETVTAVTWNVESGGADPRVLARQAATLAERGVDVMGLQEVDSQSWLDQMSGEMTGAAGQSFGSVLGTTGGNPGASRGNDFLGVVYNQDTLELKGTEELNDINRDGRGRAPLVAHFEHKDTGQEFLFVVNHLRRGSGARREDEAQDLNDWAQKQDLPVLNVGDFNWDYDLNTGAPEPDNRAMDYLTEDGVHNWVEPENKTQTYKSTRYNSILDGILTAGDAQNWGVAESRILSEAPFDGPNDKKNADHIPVLATFV